MVDFSTFSIVLTGIGLIVAITYYSLQIRNQNTTRQTQLFMDFYKIDQSLEFSRAIQEMVWMWEWEDYDDYMNRYTHLSGKVDGSSRTSSVFLHYEGLGVLVKRGLVPLGTIYDLYNTRIFPVWEKFAQIIYEWRKRGNSPPIIRTLRMAIR